MKLVVGSKWGYSRWSKCYMVWIRVMLLGIWAMWCVVLCSFINIYPSHRFQISSEQVLH